MIKRNGVIWSPQGIGGDDRCGVYAILKIIEKFKPYVLFTTDEEMGGLGADNFVKTINRDLVLPVNFAIEIDRRGYNQAVFYDCGNKDFQDFILSFGFDEEFGTFTDISVLSPAFNIASVNLSAGYYNEHTNHEYIVLEDLNHTIHMVKNILKNKRVNDYFDFQEIQHVFSDYGYKKLGDYMYNELMEEDWYFLNETEWKETYGTDKPKTEEDLYKMICDR